MDLTKDVQPLADFRNRSAAFMKRLRETKRPLVLTVNGKPAAVVQDAEAYQRLIDLVAAADEGEGVRQGRDDVAHGRTQPVEAAFAAFRAENGLPR